MRQLTGLIVAIVIAGSAGPAGPAGSAGWAGWPSAGGLLAQSTQTRVPGTFRSNVTMVPLDVRVLDERGVPITDLQAHDFTVLEDGERQDIRQFSRLELTPAPGSVAQGPAFRTAAEKDVSAPQNHRVFLIVLGRGRLQGPSKGLDALLGFIERRLLPQDQVAVLAYNRATDFTSDRRPILEVLSRFKKENGLIESKLEHWYSGPPGNSEDGLPEHVQPLIDDLFAGPHATRFRQIPPGRIADARRLADGFERGAEQAETAGIEAFDNYVSSALATRQDLGSIYTGIEYLRFIDGEKRLIYISTDGLFLPSVDDDLSLAAVASDARVAIDTIQTGGLYADPPGLRSLSERSWRHTWAISAIRNVSDYTGGRAFAYRYADEALEQIDRITRTGYLLGYVPANLVQDGAYRRIEVKVARKGARVLYRRGYYARAQLIPYDRRQFMTFSRILSATAFPGRIDDIGLELEARTSAGESGAEIAVHGRIEPDRIVLDRTDAVHTGRLELAIFAVGRRNRLVGERWITVDLSLDASQQQAFLRDGLPLDARVPVRSEATKVKVVIYDFAADAVGSVMIPVRR
jgi:VWFA-related protein